MPVRRRRKIEPSAVDRTNVPVRPRDPSGRWRDKVFEFSEALGYPREVIMRRWTEWADMCERACRWLDTSSADEKAYALIVAAHDKRDTQDRC